jgi:Flp pilus assembly protein TadG
MTLLQTRSRTRYLPRAGYLLRCESGSTLVETAITLTVVLALIFGAIEVGMMLYSYHFVSYAAREGTRYAIVRGSSCSSFSSACPAAASDIQNYVSNLGFPGIDITSSDVAVSWASYSQSTATWTACSNCNAPGDQVQVTVTYQVPWALPFLPSGNFQLTSTSAMVISQ